MLRLVRDALGEEVYQVENACYRDTSRQLAALRDSAVLIKTLNTVRKLDRPDISTATWERIHDSLVARQAAVRRELQEESNAVATVQAMLHSARGRVAGFRLNAVGSAAFTPGLRRVYRRGRRRMAVAYAVDSNPHLFHDWRKRVKYLWYHVEILQFIRPEMMAALAEDLHKLSDYLGDSHDLEVLRELLATNPEEFGPAADFPVLLDLLVQRQRVLADQARPLGSRLYAEPAKQFARRLGKYWQESHRLALSALPSG